MIRRHISVRGVVQGVGFRPFVYNTARALGLGGWVRNEADVVRIEAQGPAEAVAALVAALREHCPPQARIDALEVADAPCRDDDAAEFTILASAAVAAPRPTIPADLATCPACCAEIRTPGERRAGYPFTNCTNCGPRWSLIEQLPYDRPRTAMARFAMCPACRAEYEDPADRRFHAQPIACPACGPQLQLLDAAGRELATAEAALRQAAAVVRDGRILALKGLGGFQLVCDVTSEAAVARLRARKRRPHKPLALMMASVVEVRRHCAVSAAETAALESPQAPIMLLRRADGDPPVQPAPAVAPGNPYLGVMLPNTPLHHLLMDLVGRPIVCTSGNLSEEPMATQIEDAVTRLGPIADAILTHDRPIVRPVDDSVARVGPEGLQVLRRARGFAPLPMDVGMPLPAILAVGGHLKNAVALSLGTQVVLGAHVGDLDNVAAVAVFERAVQDLRGFFQVTPAAIACDLHPDYASTRHAERLAAEWRVPLIRVQHHHAHAAACMAEHRLAGPALALSWDGTGYGPDGTVWGGECLICEGGAFTRFSHLRPFPLPGGDRAVREPRRAALGLLFEAFGPEAAVHAAWFSHAELQTLMPALARRLNCPRTSSLGRLFDAMAVLCGQGGEVSFEGQAAMALEFAADPREPGAYPLPLCGETPAVADWEPLWRAALADRAAGVPVARIAARFHNALADWALAAAERAGLADVALTGGCFQNALLTDRVRGRLLQAGFRVRLHRDVPPGDGGLALGQVLVAAYQLAAQD